MKQNQEHKIQFGGYTKRSYKEIRKVIQRIVKKEIEESMAGGGLSNPDGLINRLTLSITRSPLQ
jgi:hypothetical protein